MAITGIIGVGFVIGHMVGNLQMFQGPEKLNHYAEALRRLGPLLLLARVILLGAVVLHVTLAAAKPGTRVSAPRASPTTDEIGRSYTAGGAMKSMVWRS